MTLSRFLSEVCLDSESLLGDCDLSLRQNIEQVLHTESDQMHNGADSQMSVKADQRTQLVRKAFKFVNQECSEEDQNRVNKFFNITWQVAQICQALCTRQAPAPKRAVSAMEQKTTFGGLSKSASIGITDYGRSSNAPTPPLACMPPVTMDKECQTFNPSPDMSEHRGSLKTLLHEPSQAELSSASEAMAFKVGPVCQLLEQLGASLDGKIDTFLQMLVNLKNVKR